MEGEPWVEMECGLVIAPYGIDHRLRWTGPWRFLVALVPRSAMAAFVPTLVPEVGVFLDQRLLGSAARRFFDGLLATDEPASAIEQYAIEQLVMEISGALLLDRIGALTENGSPRAVLRDRAIAVIAQRCSEPSLSPTTVARGVQSSLRQLQLVFSETGNSVAGEIRRQRARLARSILTDSRYDVLSIPQVAQRAGFQSPMSLRRALDEAYASTPRELRIGRPA